jgi:hypothetical protein
MRLPAYRPTGWRPDEEASFEEVKVAVSPALPDGLPSDRREQDLIEEVRMALAEARPARTAAVAAANFAGAQLAPAAHWIDRHPYALLAIRESPLTRSAAPPSILRDIRT